LKKKLVIETDGLQSIVKPYHSKDNVVAGKLAVDERNTFCFFDHPNKEAIMT